MMKTIMIIMALILFFSCSTIKPNYNNITGTFYKKSSKNGFGYEYKLELNKDYSFVLVIKMQDANPRCEGLWKLFNNDELILTCNDVENITEVLTNDYMNKRGYKVKFINANKLKFEDIVLEKVR